MPGLAPTSPAARGFTRSLTELAVVVLIGAAIGAAFEAARPAPATAANPTPAPGGARGAVLDL